jgi:hypothetical protein
MGSFKEEMDEAAKLVRLRADPKKIRVSIRKNKDKWQVTITCRSTGESIIANSSLSPEKAIMSALKSADKKNYKGIDLLMEWAYKHPWR